MADVNTRVTLYYEASGGTAPTGWTETFFSDDSSLDQILDKAQNIYLPKRVDLFGAGVVCKYIKAANIPPNRQTLTRFITGKAGENSQLSNSQQDAYDPVQVDLLIRLNTANGKQRQFWLAGIADKYTNQLVTQGMTAPFLEGPAFKQFLAAMKKAEFRIRYKVTNGPPPTYDSGLIVGQVPVMIRNRKRGRPFNLFRGRRAV